jgi:hypothetical protein
MVIPENAVGRESGVLGALPQMWMGPDAVDGDAGAWIVAPVGSIYVQKDTANQLAQTWQKVKDNSNDNDWLPIGNVGVITETVARSAFTDGGSTSGTYALKTQVPAGAFVDRCFLVDVTGFTGDTSATIIVGDGSDTDRYNTGTPSVFSTVAALDLGAVSGTAIHTAAKTVTITITSGSDFTLVTAGSLTIRLYYKK